MKLHYYRFGTNRFPQGTQNFGDDLNPWLWEKLLPGVLDDDKSTVFVGIGTLLNNHVPKAKKTAVFGSGVGLGKGLPAIDDSWKIYCLRGPLSAETLGVDPKLAVTDAAVLVRRFVQADGPKSYRFGFMPHVIHAIRGKSDVWQEICDRLGFAYIDPRWPIDQIFDLLSKTEVLLAEAMHGAIVADALRVPWIAVNTDSTVYPFKWQDWCASVGVTYQPQYLMPLWDLYPVGPGIRSSARYMAQWVGQTGVSALKYVWGDSRSRVAAQLDRIAKTSRPCLSSDRQIESLTVELEERLQQFKDDVAAGYYKTES